MTDLDLTGLGAGARLKVGQYARQRGGCGAERTSRRGDGAARTLVVVQLGPGWKIEWRRRRRIRVHLIERRRPILESESVLIKRHCRMLREVLYPRIHYFRRIGQRGHMSTARPLHLTLLQCLAQQLAGTSFGTRCLSPTRHHRGS